MSCAVKLTRYSTVVGPCDYTPTDGKFAWLSKRISETVKPPPDGSSSSNEKENLAVTY